MMKFAVSSLFIGLSLLSTSPALAHGADDPRVSLEAEVQANLQAGDKISFGFQLFDEVNKKAISDQDLQLSNTQKIHLIVYDASLKEFNHVHPSFDGKVWNSELSLHVNGAYFIWAQGQLNDGTEFSASYRTQVEGGNPALPVVDLGDHRKASDGVTVVELQNQKLVAGQMTMLNYKVTRTDGIDPVITPYLGVAAHIIAVSPDGDELIHAHPMAASNATSGMIHITFPTEGDYRIWVQLLDHNELKTVPLSVAVVK